MTPLPAPAPTLWFTGLSGAGKTTLGNAVFSALAGTGTPAQLLDADLIRPRLWPELGFTPHDRRQSVLRLAALADLFTRQGILTLVAAVSPCAHTRQLVRAASPGRFLEIFVDAPLPLCRERDPAGIYTRFRRGELAGISGLDQPYEPPPAPEVHCRTDLHSVARCVEQVLAALKT